MRSETQICGRYDRSISDRTHLYDTRTRRCSVLSTLAVSCDVSAEIQTAGGAKRVLSAMDNHKMEPHIQVPVELCVCN